MSKEHFQSIHNMIEELEKFGYRDVTDEVKPHHTLYLYLCTLERPNAERDKGPIYCTTANDLLTLLEQVIPSLLQKQVWFCEKCQAVSFVRYRRGAGFMEIVEQIGKSHRKLSSHCPYGTANLRILNLLNLRAIPSRDTLDADSTIPVWAKDRLAHIFFEEP